MYTHYTDPVAIVLLWVTLILLFGVIGHYLSVKLNQPKVLGELLMGIIVGNISYFFGFPLAVLLRESSAVFSIMQDLLANIPLSDAVHSSIHNSDKANQLLIVLSGPHASDLMKITYVLDVFARYGVIFLLFMVGLDSSLSDLKHTAHPALSVAILGMFAPLVLGLMTIYLLIPDIPLTSTLFVASTLSATSVGITASVLKDMNRLQTRESNTILGAAMIDDILGLILLAVVSGLAMSGSFGFLQVISLFVWAIIFFVGVLLVCPWFVRLVVSVSHLLDPCEAKLFLAFILAMLLAWLATTVHLAAIVGALLAGIIINDGFFSKCEARHALTIKQLIMPFESIFSPLFFMLVGIHVKLEAFLNWHVLMIALGLTIAAIVGKLISGLGADRRDDRLVIGIGMLPRGEVGLIFAATGQALGIISDSLFASVILMIIITTLITPAWLKYRFSAIAANGN